MTPQRRVAPENSGRPTALPASQPKFLRLYCVLCSLLVSLAACGLFVGRPYSAGLAACYVTCNPLPLSSITRMIFSFLPLLRCNDLHSKENASGY